MSRAIKKANLILTTTIGLYRELALSAAQLMRKP